MSGQAWRRPESRLTFLSDRCGRTASCCGERLRRTPHGWSRDPLLPLRQRAGEALHGHVTRPERRGRCRLEGVSVVRARRDRRRQLRDLLRDTDVVVGQGGLDAWTMAQLSQAETSQFTTSTCRSPRRSCATRRSRSTHGPRSAAPGVWRAAANPPLYRQRFPLCRRGTAPRPPREPRRGWAHRPRALPSRPLARRLGVRRAIRCRGRAADEGPHRPQGRHPRHSVQRPRRDLGRQHLELARPARPIRAIGSLAETATTSNSSSLACATRIPRRRRWKCSGGRPSSRIASDSLTDTSSSTTASRLITKASRRSSPTGHACRTTSRRSFQWPRGSGDPFARLIEDEGLGRTFGYKDVEGCARATEPIDDSAERERIRSNARALLPSLHGPTSSRPS